MYEYRKRLRNVTRPPNLWCRFKAWIDRDEKEKYFEIQRKRGRA
jgi:hypothetical protein